MSIVRNPLAFATRVDITYYYVQLINGVFDAHTCVLLCFKFMAAEIHWHGLFTRPIQRGDDRDEILLHHHYTAIIQFPKIRFTHAQRSKSFNAMWLHYGYGWHHTTRN